jgi:hypothetical protein
VAEAGPLELATWSKLVAEIKGHEAAAVTSFACIGRSAFVGWSQAVDPSGQCSAACVDGKE